MIDRAGLIEQFMTFLDAVDERHPDEVNVRIGYIAVEIDEGDQLDVVSGFIGEDRRYVQNAFLCNLVDERMAELCEEDD